MYISIASIHQRVKYLDKGMIKVGHHERKYQQWTFKYVLRLYIGLYVFFWPIRSCILIKNYNDLINDDYHIY